DEGTLQPRPRAPEYGEPRPRDAGAPGQIEDAETLPELPVGAGREGEHGRLPPGLDHPVRFLAPFRHLLEGDVRGGQEQLPDALVGPAHDPVQLGDAGAYLTHLLDEGPGVLAPPLALADLPG